MIRQDPRGVDRGRRVGRGRGDRLVLEQVAEAYDGRAKVVKINVDEENAVAGSMGVRSIPTIVLYHKGEPKKTLVGARPKEEFIKLLDEALAE